MINTRAVITTGIRGARIDFVAGWLGTLPTFVDSQWRIDPETGRSFGIVNIIRDADKFDIKVDNILKDFGFQLDLSSNVNLSVSCHGRRLENNIINQQAVTIIRVNTTKADPKKIYWEFLVKTYLTKERWKHAHDVGQFYQVDQELINKELEITDTNRQKFLLSRINNYFSDKDPGLTGLSFIDINYDELFQPGGSKNLVNRLGLDTATEQHHRLWDANLQFAESPTTIERFGKVWQKQDYFD
jgi:sarcosine oxidase delta subunit